MVLSSFTVRKLLPWLLLGSGCSQPLAPSSPSAFEPAAAAASIIDALRYEADYLNHVQATLALPLTSYGLALGRAAHQPLPAVQVAWLQWLDRSFGSVGGLLVASAVSSAPPTADDLAGLAAWRQGGAVPASALPGSTGLRLFATLLKTAVYTLHLGGAVLDLRTYLPATTALTLANDGGGSGQGIQPVKTVSFAPGTKEEDGCPESNTAGPTSRDMRTSVTKLLGPIDQQVAVNSAVLNWLAANGADMENDPRVLEMREQQQDLESDREQICQLMKVAAWSCGVSGAPPKSTFGRWTCQATN